jgi:hypothetical protein
VSVWSASPQATTFTVMTAIWLVVTHWLAAGLGGYLTGRLRTQWVATHTHEVFFRDTAHGLATWALATLLTVAALASATTALVSGGTRVAGFAAASHAADSGYELDLLFRGGNPDAAAAGAGANDVRAEALRILANGLAGGGEVPATERDYLASLVSTKTGVSQAQAQERVDEFIARSKATLERARKATAAAALFTALSMLVGAFIACVAAALGGQQRDRYVAPARSGLRANDDDSLAMDSLT